MVEQHIIYLLSKTNCLVIPDLGGFLATYRSSQWSEIKKTFFPPQKTILFNPNLTLNDGQLLNELIKSGNSPQEASLTLSKWVSEIKAKLNTGQRVEIKQLGFLFKDEFNQIHFIQDTRSNLLPSSYGLYPLTIFPINTTSEKENNYSANIPSFKDRKEHPSKDTSEKRKVTNSSIKKWTISIAAVLVVILSFWIWGNRYTINKQFASFSPEFNYQPIHYNLDLHSKNTQPFYAIPDTSGLYELTISNFPNLKPILVKVEAKRDSLAVKLLDIAKPVSSPVVTIIGGCFSNPQNAQNFLQKLLSEGYNAQIIPQKNSGLYRVIFGKYPSRAEALLQLQKIKNNYPNAWITSL